MSNKGLDLESIEARSRAALRYERSRLDRDAGAYVTADGPARETMACPLCDEGEVEAQRFDDTGDKASTIVAYGIGDGLRLAEEWVEHGAADALALVAEVRRLRASAAAVPALDAPHIIPGDSSVIRELARQTVEDVARALDAPAPTPQSRAPARPGFRAARLATAIGEDYIGIEDSDGRTVAVWKGTSSEALAEARIAATALTEAARRVVGSR